MSIPVVQNTHNFETGLGTWNSRPVAKKNWSNFKTHIKASKTELKNIRGTTMQHDSLHHDNCIVTQLRDNISSQNTEMLVMLQAMTVYTPTTENNKYPPPTHTYNEMMQGSIQVETIC